MAFNTRNRLAMDIVKTDDPEANKYIQSVRQLLIARGYNPSKVERYLYEMIADEDTGPMMRMSREKRVWDFQQGLKYGW